MRGERSDECGLIDFGNEPNHYLKTEDDYLSWWGSDAPGFVKRYGFPQ